MRRHEHYVESGINQLITEQMHHMTSQRIQQSQVMGHLSGRGDSLRTDEHQYISPKAEGQWHWEKGMQKGLDVYREGQGIDTTHSLFQGQRLDANFGEERQTSKGSRVEAHMDVTDVGYRDTALPQAFEELEQKFIRDITALTKEQQDAEDTENSRHKERLSDVNAQYQDKLMILRARQATHREEFLRKESQARHQHYQQVHLTSYQNIAVPSEIHGYGSISASGSSLGDMQRGYASSRYESYGDRADIGGERGHGLDSRGLYPGGRNYSPGGHFF